MDISGNWDWEFILHIKCRLTDLRIAHRLPWDKSVDVLQNLSYRNFSEVWREKCHWDRFVVTGHLLFSQSLLNVKYGLSHKWRCKPNFIRNERDFVPPSTGAVECVPLLIFAKHLSTFVFGLVLSALCVGYLLCQDKMQQKKICAMIMKEKVI